MLMRWVLTAAVRVGDPDVRGGEVRGGEVLCVALGLNHISALLRLLGPGNCLLSTVRGRSTFNVWLS